MTLAMAGPPNLECLYESTGILDIPNDGGVTPDMPSAGSASFSGRIGAPWTMVKATRKAPKVFCSCIVIEICDDGQEWNRGKELGEKQTGLMEMQCQRTDISVLACSMITTGVKQRK